MVSQAVYKLYACMQKHEDKNKTLTEMRIYGREPDYPTEERRQEFVKASR